jgi:hypothetical protein
MNPNHKLWLEDPRSNVAPKPLIVTKKGKNCMKPNDKSTSVKKKINETKNKMET